MASPSIHQRQYGKHCPTRRLRKKQNSYVRCKAAFRPPQVPTQLLAPEQRASQMSESFVAQVQPWLRSLHDASALLQKKAPLLLPATTTELASVGITATIGSLALLYARSAGSKLIEVDGLPLAYDVARFQQYFSRQPLRVSARAIEVIWKSAGFAFAVQIDRARGEEEKNKTARAEQCVRLLSDLGPAFIKVGQALSIRVDLLDAAFIDALATLQDRVPPFDSNDAREILRNELDAPINQVFSQFPDLPVASASLGQVYKASLNDGRTVAVKVQRPGIHEEVALDLILIRSLVPWIRKWQNLNTDLQAVCDEWGTRFIAELDYRQEARNGARFQQVMRDRGFSSVSAATPLMHLSTQRVLTSEWVDGQRLEQAEPDKVPRLAAVALQCYLTMLLDDGVLHADPHPGNLLLSNDGTLTILDWGLCCYVSKEKQYALIDYISHLVSEDYNAIPNDLISLGFVVPGAEDKIGDSEVVEVLGSILSELSGGGGAKKLDVDKIQSTIGKLVQEQGNLFMVPAYFLYILRCFTTLEGIGLSVDPDYAIVQECWPYLATRLVTDESERTQKALRRMLFGSSGKLDTQRLLKIQRSVSDFTMVSKNGITEESQQSQMLDMLFNPKGCYLQDLLLEEAAHLVDVSVADAVTRSLSTPFLERANPHNDGNDKAALDTASEVAGMIRSAVSSNNGISNGSVQQVVQTAAPHTLGIAAAAGRFGAALARRAVDRAARAAG